MNNFQNEIEEKIHTLTELIIDNDENGYDESDELIHPDFIRGLEALGQLQQNGDIDDEEMIELNKLYEKHKRINEKGSRGEL